MVSTRLLVAALVGPAASAVDAHGTLAKPGLMFTFTGKAYGNDFSATTPMNKLSPRCGEKFTSYLSWTANAKAFGNTFKAPSYMSLKEFIFKN
uniref:Uncharacterized protein n=1 Tax=Globisporangium ultimum (strain ATCC 200006 / CBS 805.95 / DAOM BR144) TaxID=431595 RepID=K3X571_GLOUD